MEGQCFEGGKSGRWCDIYLRESSPKHPHLDPVFTKYKYKYNSNPITNTNK